MKNLHIDYLEKTYKSNTTYTLSVYISDEIFVSFNFKTRQQALRAKDTIFEQVHYFCCANIDEELDMDGLSDFVSKSILISSLYW
mgnify:CR=1 FL=1